MNNKPSYSSKVLGNALLITIPSPKEWPTIIFFIVWVVFWTFGGVFALQEIGHGEADLFLCLWSIIWVVFEVLGIYHLLWQIVGKEEIEVTPDSIAIRQVILGISRSKIYTCVNISHMRVDSAGREKPYPPDSEGISFSKGTGMIAFNYGKKTIRMGIGVNEAKSKELVPQQVKAVG